MSNIIGNQPNQVPTNADLGSMAFRDLDPYVDSVSAEVSVAPAGTATLDQFGATQFRTAKYIVQATYGAVVYSSEILLTHDGTYTYYTEYARLTNQPTATLAGFTATITDELVEFKFTNNTAFTVEVTATRLGIIT